MSYCLAQTSLAHTYGNVTAFMLEYIKGLFPRDYFSTVTVSSKIAFKEFDILKNTRSDVFKKTKPMLIIKPRVEIETNDNFLGGTYLTTRIDDNYCDVDFSNLQEFINDKSRGAEMKFLLNRIRMVFEVAIITETQIDQLNQAFYFKNRVRQDIPFFLSTSLESYIPRDMMELLGKDVGIPVYDENGSVKPFLDYVNSNSIYPVSYKMKNSSGHDEFFRFYPVNIDTMITGLSIDDGSKRGMVSDTFTISFSVITEFNTAGLYYYFSERPEVIDEFVLGMGAQNDDGRIIPLFTIKNLHSETLPDGWTEYAAPIYKVESPDKPDELDIKPILNNSLIRCINYHKENGIPLDVFMQVIVMRDNRVLTPYKDYHMDFNNYTLITKKINMDSTYRLIINVNTHYINNLIKELFNLDEEK